jgi:hypothetical protein
MVNLEACWCKTSLFSFSFLVVLGVELCLELARQALYPLSHFANLFSVDIFDDLDPQSYLCFLR